MSYLDRDAVLDLIASCNLEDLQGWDYEDINPEQTEAVREAILMAVEQMDTADTVDVVRCKDCVYSEAGTDNRHWCDVWGNTSRPDDYCSLGRRKDG